MYIVPSLSHFLPLSFYLSLLLNERGTTAAWHNNDMFKWKIRFW